MTEKKCATCKYEKVDRLNLPCSDCGLISKGKWKPKELPFEPEYFSGLNWREAEKLVGKVVEFSDDGNHWTAGTFSTYSGVMKPSHKFLNEKLNAWIYIRTTPETYAHPTITIGGVKLPRPEHIEPFAGTHYFSVDNGNVVKRVWSACPYDMEKLMAGNVHRTESRAQEWADWWQKTVIDKLK
jgi:hypothetical protein